MKRLYLLCALSCFCYIAALADEDCDQAVYEAKIAYNAGNYAKAKSLFDYVVSECGANYGNAASWVQKCKDELTPKLTASRTYISVGATSGTTSINVTSNREWKLQNTTSDMFSVSKNGGSVTINYYTNSKSSSRSDYFDIVTLDGSKSVRITITQSAAAVTLTVSKTAVSCSASGTTEYLTVSCSKAWEIQYPSGNMYSATRNGNTVIVKINANTSTSSRDDFFNIRTTDGSQSVRISLSQSGKSSTPTGTPTAAQVDKMSANIVKVWTEHNVYQDGVKGMKIHVHFDNSNMLGFKGWCIAWFYNADGTNMKNSIKNSYVNHQNSVGVWKTFIPSFNESSYDNFVLFMPNSEITGRGENLYYKIAIQEFSTGKLLAISQKQYFNYK